MVLLHWQVLQSLIKRNFYLKPLMLPHEFRFCFMKFSATSLFSVPHCKSIWPGDSFMRNWPVIPWQKKREAVRGATSHIRRWEWRLHACTAAKVSFSESKSNHPWNVRFCSTLLRNNFKNNCSSFSGILYQKKNCLYISIKQSGLTNHNPSHVMISCVCFKCCVFSILHLHSLVFISLERRRWGPLVWLLLSVVSGSVSGHTQILWWTCCSHLQLCRHVAAQCDPHRTKPHQSQCVSCDSSL